MREHIDGLHGGDAIISVHVMQVTGLCGRVAADIDDALGGSTQDGLHHVGMHTGTWRVGDDDVRPPVFSDEVIGEDVLHVAGKEQRVRNAV